MTAQYTAPMQPSLSFTSDSSLGGRSLQCLGTKHFIHLLIKLSQEQEERERLGIKQPCSFQYLISWKKQLQGETIISFIHVCLSALSPETVTAVLRNSVQKNHYAFLSNGLGFFKFQRLKSSTIRTFSSRVTAHLPYHRSLKLTDICPPVENRGI